MQLYSYIVHHISVYFTVFHHNIYIYITIYYHIFQVQNSHQWLVVIYFTIFHSTSLYFTINSYDKFTHISSYFTHISPDFTIFHHKQLYINHHIQLYSFICHHISLYFTVFHHISPQIAMTSSPYKKAIIHRYTSIQHRPGASQRTTTGAWPRQPPRRPGPRPAAQKPGRKSMVFMGKKRKIHGKTMENPRKWYDIKVVPPSLK